MMGLFYHQTQRAGFVGAHLYLSDSFMPVTPWIATAPAGPAPGPSAGSDPSSPGPIIYSHFFQ